MARLSHPNVITVHEVGTVGNRDYVATELIDGGTVAEWLRQPRPRAEVLRVLCAAGRGLAAAHSAGLVHRDFKPHNVLLGRDRRVLVTDFGLVRGLDDGPVPGAVEPDVPARSLPSSDGATSRMSGLEETLAPAPGSLSSTLTRTGAVLGTPAYMAPEQFVGTGTPASDQFALCVALWEGLAGQRPFRGDSFEEMRSAVEAAKPSGGDAIPRRIRTALERGLRRDPGARWPSVAALLDAIEHAMRAPRRQALGAGVIVAAGGVAAAVLSMRGGAPARRSPCPPGEPMLAVVQTKIAALAKRVGHLPQWPTIQQEVDAFFPRWRAAWVETCAAPESPAFHGEVACLTGALDEMTAGADAVLGLPPELVARLFEADSNISSRYLPDLAECKRGARVGYPPPPSDAATRERVAAVRRQLMAVAVVIRSDPEAATHRAAEGVKAARALEGVYPAIVAEALLLHAIAVHVAGDVAAAGPLYRESALAAERAGHDPVRAKALHGELETVSSTTTDRAIIDPLAARARAAMERAGENTALVEILLATVESRRGEHDAAIARIVAARRAFEVEGNQKRVELTIRLEAEFRRRGDANAAETPPASP